MPIFGIFRDFLPGSYRAKTGPGTPFWAKSSKWGLKFRAPGVPGRGFYINPSRRGPAVPGGWRKGRIWTSPAGRGILGLPEAPEGPPGTPDPGTPRGSAGTGDQSDPTSRGVTPGPAALECELMVGHKDTME